MDVVEILNDNLLPVTNVFQVFLSRDLARFIYNTMETSPFFDDAVNSIASRQVSVVVFDAGRVSIEWIKKNVQGPFGTKDPGTIRGLLSRNGAIQGSFVHVPDTFEKADDDLIAMNLI
jgi:nucleoside diphosphate kinase